MDSADSVTVAFEKAKLSLKPYIKTRQEALRIRQVLASHLERHIEYEVGHPKLTPLSLVNEATGVNAPSKSLVGLRRDYIKSLRANMKAREDYNRVCGARTLGSGDSGPRKLDAGAPLPITASPERTDPLEAYIASVRRNQRLERLRILQDHVNKLEQNFVAATSYLDQASASVSSLPKVPADIIKSDLNAPEPNQRDLQDLIHGLEKAVLQAKSQLKREKSRFEHLLNAQKLHEQAGHRPISKKADRLQALGQARNELIMWIEAELGKAGASTPQISGGDSFSTTASIRDTVNQQLAAIKTHYNRYAEIRKEFVEATGDQAFPGPLAGSNDIKESDAEDTKQENTPAESWVMLPFLRELLSLSNEQKSLIQLKSHLTVSLAKQHKETDLALDKLADESHLLPSYSSSAQKEFRPGLGQFGNDEMLGKEMPDTIHRARTWAQAADLAGSATQKDVLAKTQEGEDSVEGARQLLLTLDGLLGNQSSPRKERIVNEFTNRHEEIWTSDIGSKTQRSLKPKRQTRIVSTSGDIWASLNGQLGVLKGDHNE